MLSTDVRTLREKLETYRNSGVFLTSAAVASLCSTIKAVEDGVHLMEQHAVKQPCIRVLPLKQEGGVVNLAAEKYRREIEGWISGQGVTVLRSPDPDGGDAA